MTRDTDSVDARLRDDLLDTLDEVARQTHWNGVIARRSSPLAAPARRPRRRHMRVLAIAVALVLVGGSALAIGADGLLSVSDDDAPTPDRIDQFQRNDVERATPEEYEQLRTSTMVPAVKRIGILKDSEMKPLFELAPNERSRVVADDPEVGRVVAVPSIDRKHVCYLYTAPDSRTGSAGQAGCSGDLPATGVNLSFSGLRAPDDLRKTSNVVSGFAADDVDRVQLDLADGRRVDARLVSNAVYWSESGTSASRPVQVVTTRGDRTCFEDVDYMARTKPPAAPHCEPTTPR